MEPRPLFAKAPKRRPALHRALVQAARKPMSDLRAADGALGSPARLVSICFQELERRAATVSA